MADWTWHEPGDSLCAVLDFCVILWGIFERRCVANETLRHVNIVIDDHSLRANLARGFEPTHSLERAASYTLCINCIVCYTVDFPMHSDIFTFNVYLYMCV